MAGNPSQGISRQQQPQRSGSRQRNDKSCRTRTADCLPLRLIVRSGLPLLILAAGRLLQPSNRLLQGIPAIGYLKAASHSCSDQLVGRPFLSPKAARFRLWRWFELSRSVEAYNAKGKSEANDRNYGRRLKLGSFWVFGLPLRQLARNGLPAVDLSRRAASTAFKSMFTGKPVIGSFEGCKPLLRRINLWESRFFRRRRRGFIMALVRTSA